MPIDPAIESTMRSDYEQRKDNRDRVKHRKYMREYYRTHPEKYTSLATLDARLRYYRRNHVRMKEHRLVKLKEHQAFISEHKKRPCADCGVSYPPYVMDFDHVRGVKKFALGTNGASRSMNRIIEEIAKCDVICSNCHRERTQRRLAEQGMLREQR